MQIIILLATLQACCENRIEMPTTGFMVAERIVPICDENVELNLMAARVADYNPSKT